MTYDSRPATKGDVDLLRQEFEQKLDTVKEEIMRHFDVVVETIRHDLLGANRDDIELLKDGRTDHERRIRRLERSTGIIVP